MRNQNKIRSILKITFMALAIMFITGGCEKTLTTVSESDQNSKYLDAVREFADNVLEYGRDTYGEHTPLFVDGLMVRNPDDPNYGEDGIFKPVEWISPEGERWVLSNLASQQNLFRTLDGLSTITGDPKYKQAAMEATEYAFENLRSPNGLLYWGGHQAYDAAADKPCGRGMHELKAFYPYYQLMWEVDPQATKQFIEAFWSAHILDWSNLDMNRQMGFGQSLEKPWEYEYKGGPVFLEGTGRSFFNTGTDLIYAAALLTKLSGDKEPLAWAKRLAQRYVDTRHPNTGIGYLMYTKPEGEVRESYDNVMRRLVPGTVDFLVVEFPLSMYTNPILREAGFGQFTPTPGISIHKPVFYWQSQFLVGEMSGEEGGEFEQWALEELTAFGKASYRKEDNVYVPILTDGTNLEGYVVKEDGPLGPKGVTLEPLPAGPSDFWAYAMGNRVTGDEFMWEMARSIALGNEFGDIGETLGAEPELNIQTGCSDPYALLGFLELHKKTGSRTFLEMAKKIGDNILGTRFHKGFFVASNKHIYAKFDAIDSLALLHLYSELAGEVYTIPEVWPSDSIFEMYYREKDITWDNQIIYILTESDEPPMSLQEAAAVGDIDLVRSIIEKGAGVDSIEDGYRKTALHRASISGHIDVVELLIAEGAGVNAGDDGNVKPLHYAAQNGHKEIAELLITNGADINAKSSVGDTPLHSAVRAGHEDIVELLIANGADVDARNDAGYAPLDIARRLNSTEIVELVQSQDVDISSIHTAAQLGDLTRVEAFLEGGMDVNAKDENGQTPLYIAVRNNHEDIVELLIGHGADVNTTDQSNYTPLYYAIFNTNKNIVSLLVDKGADVNLTREEDYTLLHYAVWMGDLDIVKLLVDKGANFDVKALEDWTAFRYAAWQGSRDMVELFISKGVDASSLHMAAFIGDLSRVKALVEQGTEVDTKDEAGWTALFWAICSGQTEVAEFLIDNNADISANDGRGRSLLHQALIVPTVDFKLVELLISNGIDVDIRDNLGNTLLHLTSRQDVAEFLIDKGADINAKDNRGLAPLHLAARSGQKDMVEFLLAKGADASIVNNMGRTPLDLATNQGCTEIVEILRKHGAND